jgi:hypothetical protein
MEDTLLRMPVMCPECAREWLMEVPIASIAEALASNGYIRLYAPCHDKVWEASCLEREQLGEYLEVANLSRSARKIKVLGSLAADPCPRATR